MPDRLIGVHPDLIDKIRRIQNAMGALGFDLYVTTGVRTVDEQWALYQQGRKTPGAIVTNADGLTKKSNHQAHADGYGHAVDCCFLDEAGAASWADTWPWALYGAMGKALGLTWGGDFTTIVDRPHLELSA